MACGSHDSYMIKLLVYLYIIHLLPFIIKLNFEVWKCDGCVSLNLIFFFFLFIVIVHVITLQDWNCGLLYRNVYFDSFIPKCDENNPTITGERGLLSCISSPARITVFYGVVPKPDSMEVFSVAAQICP